MQENGVEVHQIVPSWFVVPSLTFTFKRRKEILSQKKAPRAWIKTRKLQGVKRKEVGLSTFEYLLCARHCLCPISLLCTTQWGEFHSPHYADEDSWEGLSKVVPLVRVKTQIPFYWAQKKKDEPLSLNHAAVILWFFSSSFSSSSPPPPSSPLSISSVSRTDNSGGLS